jgi:hypothetical protein
MSAKQFIGVGDLGDPTCRMVSFPLPAVFIVLVIASDAQAVPEPHG